MDWGLRGGGDEARGAGGRREEERKGVKSKGSKGRAEKDEKREQGDNALSCG